MRTRNAKKPEILKSGRSGDWVYYVRNGKQCRRLYGSQGPAHSEATGAPDRFWRRVTRVQSRPGGDAAGSAAIAGSGQPGPQPSAAATIGTVDRATVLCRQKLQKAGTRRVTGQSGRLGVSQDIPAMTDCQGPTRYCPRAPPMVLSRTCLVPPMWIAIHMGGTRQVRDRYEMGTPWIHRRT